jgi:hypothetical protein
VDLVCGAVADGGTGSSDSGQKLREHLFGDYQPGAIGGVSRGPGIHVPGIGWDRQRYQVDRIHKDASHRFGAPYR